MKQQQPGYLAVKHLGGLADKSFPCWLSFDERGLGVEQGRNRTRLEFAWDEVSSVSFDDPGRTKANIAALAVFGLLAIGSRRTFSLITIVTMDKSAYFESPFAIGIWRANAPQIWKDVPDIRGKLYVEETLVTQAGLVAEPTPTATGASPIPEQIRQLGELRNQGLLTQAEFDAKKSELLSRM